MADVKTVKMFTAAGNVSTNVLASEVKLYEEKGWETEANRNARLKVETELKAAEKKAAEKKAAKKKAAEADDGKTE